ncbi:MAG: winged helix-turn-helix domain-containing protein [Roseburia sp.]|nr:winged helix-turn-helix domain-containing protein [Roseburia sp.]
MDEEVTVIGRILVVEFDERDMDVFDEIMRSLEHHPAFERMRLSNEETLSLSELEIYPARRKVYFEGGEINLMPKEFDLLCFLAINKGQVLTYAQIYEKVWGGNSVGDENISVGYHICKGWKTFAERYDVFRCNH